MPQSAAAAFIVATIEAFRWSLSSNVLSRVILPVAHNTRHSFGGRDSGLGIRRMKLRCARLRGEPAVGASGARRVSEGFGVAG